MKKVVFAIAAALLLCVFAAAQAQDSPYQVNWYANNGNIAGADQFLRIVNTGVVNSPIGPNEGRICANIYVFDTTQEMMECCSCTVTANGLVTFSLAHDLLQNPLTGSPAPTSGVIKILATTAAPAPPRCNEEGVAAAVLTQGLVAWQGHIEQPVAGQFVTDTDQYAPATLSATELNFLGQACSFVHYLGSGKGHCGCGVGSNN